MIASLTLAAGLGTLAILFDGLGNHGERALVTSLIISAASMLCLACAIVLGKRRVRVAMWTGVGSALVALVLWLVVVWFNVWRWPGDWDEVFIETAFVFTTISIWAAHFGLLILPPILRRSWRWVRFVTLVLAALVALTVILVVLTETFEDWSAKLIAVLSILGGCGTGVTPVLAIIERVQRRGDPIALPRRLKVQLVCPRCRSSQEILAGSSQCASCGLRIKIDIEEPRCACGYPLYQLRADRCPECGRVVEPGTGWVSEGDDAPG